MTTEKTSQPLEELLVFLQRSRGFDFTGYKRASLARRIDKRVRELGVSGYSGYWDYLQVHPEEFHALFDAILINVTSFFRDAAAWEALEKDVLPAVLAQKTPDQPIRVWSAGCASGEEAYSIAILLAEKLGREAFGKRVKIYATDVDDDALAQARQATYGPRNVASLAPERVGEFFEAVGTRFLFDKDLRRSVIFGRHDLIQDAPISRVDLLICRNVIMYLNAETQAKVLGRLHFALNDGGVLFLGKAEMLLSHKDLFSPVDLKCRLFTRVRRAGARESRLLGPVNGSGGAATFASPARVDERLRDAAFDAAPVAQLVVDATGTLVAANVRARLLFGLSPSDVGRSFKDLEVSYRPIELRAPIAQATRERGQVSLHDVAWTTAKGESYFDVEVVPLLDDGRTVSAVQISCADVTDVRKLRDDIKAASSELEAAYAELQSTSEELETTNEELQSAVEELETTNEELQSSNEELQTTNEELESTNEELQTTNDELRQRSDQNERINAFLTAILASLRDAVVAMDKDLHVTVWSDKAQDLWGLRAEEVSGKNFFNLDIGLPVEALRAPIRACFSDGRAPHEVTLAATNRRGKKIGCRVTCLRIQGAADGVILLMREEKTAR